MLVPLFLISCLNGFASSFISLQVSPDFACIGETVTFSCATSHPFLKWRVTFTDRTIGRKEQIFEQSDNPKSLFKHVYGQQLQFRLISTANGVIESIFVVQASTLMENAMIECGGSEIHHLMFRLAYAPDIPTGIILNEIHYGSTFANVSLTWNEPAGRVDSYSIEVSSAGLTLNHYYSVTESELTLDEMPYNEYITTTISAVNCLVESEMVNISFVISGCNSTLSPPLNGLLYNNSEISNGVAAKGEQLWFGCEPGFYPRDAMVTMCQEDGLWHPDPSEVDCHWECLVPMNLSNLELTRSDSGDNASSLTVVLRCRDGFSPADDRMAVCSRNGTWIPDLEKFECHNISAVVPNITNTSTNDTDSTDRLIYIIAGSVVGSVTLLVICGPFIPVMIYCMLRHHAKKGDVSSCDRPDVPVYECITSGPVYEYLNPTVVASDLVMTENEAYNTCRNKIRVYDHII